ncbi:MAG: hypothetical protein K2L12_03840 [Clostridia bacterium]|nr:hypothetical protein [Clostridia bacterium]
MSTLLKYKKVIIAVLITLAVITSIVAFSVSYAKWTTPNSTITANGTLGNWSTAEQPVDTYTLKIEGDGNAYVFEEYDGSYTITFHIVDGIDKNFNILNNNQVLTGLSNKFSNNSKNCVTTNGNSAEYFYKTAGVKSGTYFIIIEKSTATFTFVPYVTDEDDGIAFSNFKDAIDSPHTMRAFLGSSSKFFKGQEGKNKNSYGIITSVGDKYEIFVGETAADKKSEKFTLNKGDMFAGIIHNSRLQYDANTYKVDTAINPAPKGATYIFEAKVAGTYYLTYTTNNNAVYATASTVTIKCVDRLEISDSNGICKQSVGLSKNSDTVYSATFDYVGGENVLDVYLGDNRQTLTIADDDISGEYISLTDGRFIIKDRGTYTVTVTDTDISVSFIPSTEEPPVGIVRQFISGDTTVDLAKGNAQFTVANGETKSFKVYYGETEVTTVTTGADYVTYNSATGFTASAGGDYTVSLDTDGKLTVEFKAEIISAEKVVTIQFGETVYTSTQTGNTYSFAQFRIQKDDTTGFYICIDGVKQIFTEEQITTNRGNKYDRISYNDSTGEFSRTGTYTSNGNYTVTVTLDDSGTITNVHIVC